MKVKGYEVITRALMDMGCGTVFTIAGDHTLPLMDHMSDEGFRFIDVRHEQAAVDMANAYGRITGRPGVTLFTTPGHANAIPGLTFAYHMESPVVNIAGCAPQEHLGLGASQEIDQVGMASPVTKGAWMLSDPRRAHEFISRAFRTALNGRRGPVHLTIPLDVQEGVVSADEVRSRRAERSVGGHPPRAADADVRAAVDLLQSAERPIIIAANGAYGVEGRDIRRLVECTGIPIFTEESARGVISDDHPLCAGYADGRVNDAAKSIREADALLLLGKKLDYTVSFGGPPTIDAGAKVIQVEPVWEHVGGSVGVEIGIAADPGAVTQQLADEAEARRWSPHPMMDGLRSSAAAQRSSLERRAEQGEQLHAMDAHTAVREFIDEDTCMVFEGADFGFYGASYHPAVKRHRWITNGTLGMLGWGVSYGVGAQAALPDSKVVVFTGDGGFGFNGFEVDTAVRHRLPIVFIVGNDRVWGIDYHQQVRLFGKAVATTMLPTRFDRIAEAMGAHGELVTGPDEMRPALERAFDADGPAVVNVMIEPSPSPLTEWIIERKVRESA